MEPKKPMGATEFPATLTVAPETAAPAESFTEPEIRPPAVAALGRIVTGFGDRITPTASAKRAETAISDTIVFPNRRATRRPTIRTGFEGEAGPPRWRTGVFT